MFCYKCGNKITDDARFCYKCGTKVLNESMMEIPLASSAVEKEKSNHIEDISLTNISQQMSDFPMQMTEQENCHNSSNEIDKFIYFVDQYVREKTKFQSANDLLTNSKPWTFVWVCFVISSVIGFILGVNNGVESAITGTAIIGIFFGYIFMYIIGIIIRVRYRAKFYGEFEGDINYEKFRSFLQQYLKYISPYFHECGYLTQRGVSASIVNRMAKAMNEISICCKFGSKKKKLAVIWIRPDGRYANSKRMQYGVHAVPNGFLLDGRAAGLFGQDCLIKTAPILHAAMEYYLYHFNEDMLTIQNNLLNERNSIVQEKINKETNKPKRSWGRVSLIIIGIVGVILIFAMIYNGFIDKNNKVNRNEKYINMIKSSTLEQYPQKTVGEAFDEFIDKEVWDTGITEDGTKFVNVSGEILYAGKEVDIVVQFVFDKDEEYFEYNACEIDGVPQNDLVVSILFNSIYSDSILADDPISVNRITIGETQLYENPYWGDMEVTVDYAEFSDKIASNTWFGYEYPDEGSVFLVVGITVKNVGTTTASFTYGTLVYDGSYQYQPYYTSDFGNLEPLTSPVSGIISFMVPRIVAESDNSLLLNINDWSDEEMISFVLKSDKKDINEKVNDFTYNGISLSNLIGCDSIEIYDYFGNPTYGTPVDGDLIEGGEYYGYENIAFCMDYTTSRVTWIVGDPKYIEFNGSALNKSREELIDLLGEPINEEYTYDDMEECSYYVMEYIINGVTILFEISDVSDVADIFYLTND